VFDFKTLYKGGCLKAMKTIMIIDDDKEWLETIFEAKLSQWNIDSNIVSNETFGDIDEKSLPQFTSEVVSIAQSIQPELEIIFLDLGLNRADESASLGFKLARSLRDIFFDVPIVALTRFGQAEIMEEGYLYDFDKYLTKPEFAELGAVKFSGLLHQVVRKREKLIEKIPELFQKLTAKRGDEYSSVSAFGLVFSSCSSNFEQTLNDTVSIHKEFDRIKKQTVIVFADLCDSTAIKEKQGFFEGLYMTRLHNEMVTEVIHQNKGKVVKYIGDCVMGRFDYSDPNKVDASAINAAININEAIEHHNSLYRKGAEYKIGTKIGISIGRVVEFYGNDPQGSCVDMASRLQSIARPGQILISGKLQAFVNAADISSTLGRAVNRRSEEYLLGPFEMEIRGFKDPQKIYGIHWSKEKYGLPNV